MFERIGDILPRFQAYERLFPSNERLVQSLSIVYVDILKFCSDVKAVFRRGNRGSSMENPFQSRVFRDLIASLNTSCKSENILNARMETIQRSIRRPLEQIPRA